eukprot:2344089-Pyramimonas_sp.AAC.1
MHGRLVTTYSTINMRAMLAAGASGESSGRKRGTGHRVRKGEGERWVLRASLPLLAQEDPKNE